MPQRPKAVSVSLADGVTGTKVKKKGKSQRRQRQTGLLGEKIPKFSYHCRFITPRQQRPKAVLG